jgi:putative membrane protein
LHSSIPPKGGTTNNLGKTSQPQSDWLNANRQATLIVHGQFNEETMTGERIIWDADFNDAVTTYWLTNGTLIFCLTVFGIPLIPLWYIFGKWFTRKYLASHKCTLTDRSLKVSKGVLTKIEKTVPLDRITDVGIVQGPLMRYFKIEALSVETAGQSSVGSLIRLAGIKEGRKFRDAVLNQRDAVVGSVEEDTKKSYKTPQFENGKTEELLTEIRDTLLRMEKSQNDSMRNE